MAIWCYLEGRLSDLLPALLSLHGIHVCMPWRAAFAFSLFCWLLKRKGGHRTHHFGGNTDEEEEDTHPVFTLCFVSIYLDETDLYIEMGGFA